MYLLLLLFLHSFHILLRAAVSIRYCVISCLTCVTSLPPSDADVAARRMLRSPQCLKQ